MKCRPRHESLKFYQYDRKNKTKVMTIFINMTLFLLFLSYWFVFAIYADSTIPELPISEISSL